MRNQVMLWSVCLGLLLFLGLLAVLLPVIGPVADAALGVSVLGIVGVGLHEARVELPAYHARVETQAQALKEAQEYQRWINPMHQAALDAEHRRKMAERAMQLQEDMRAIPQYGGLAAPRVTGFVQVTPVFKPQAQIAAPEQIAAPQYNQPDLEWLISHLEEDSLTVSPGIAADTGKPVVVDMMAVPHLKIIGSTGFGKSCLAAAMMQQATRLNSPEVLQLALLDLEHKTSRLLEQTPHIARLRAGSRTVDMVASNADEVVQHLSILKHELDRRTRLAEPDLAREPVLLMYVEEMLALQYEEIDPVYLARMFKDLTILAVRGRKYAMFLLACMQTDYSTKEMQITQKMFRFRSAAAIDTTAARAAGFMNAELIKENFANGKPGQFVVEYPSFSGIVLAPRYDVKRELAKLDAPAPRFRGGSERETPEPFQVVKGPRNAVETVVKSDEITLEAEVAELLENGWGKVKIIEKIWREKPGATAGYQRACQEYEDIITRLQEGA